MTPEASASRPTMDPGTKPFQPGPSMSAVLICSRPGHDNPEGSGTRYYSRARVNQTSPFESLPVEIINNITDNLDGHYTVLLRRVSKAFNNIFSCHDVVSHALVRNYPYSWEATLPKCRRTKSVFDAVARRTYTQPRRRSPRVKERLNCFPVFCEEEEQVLVYQTGEQMWSKLWECTLWDLKRNSKVVVGILDGRVGGCYNELGELYQSAVLEDVRCYRGRGVMVVQGRHRHLKWLNSSDVMRGGFEEGEVELGHYGVHVAPRSLKHSHTFIQVYSLRQQTLGQLISSFSFYGNTPLDRPICNHHFFAAFSGGAIFIFNFPKELGISSSQPALHLKTLLQKLPQFPPAIWTRTLYNAHKCILAPDSLGKFLFVYKDQGHVLSRSTATILSTKNGNIVKVTRLGESRGCFEWRLERDDSRLLTWRFEPGIQPKSRRWPATPMESKYGGLEEGEEVRLTWVGTYGLYGTRGYRVGVDGLDSDGVFTGEKTPVMVEWRVNTLGGQSLDGSIFNERVVPTLYFSPTEFDGKGGGVMGVPEQVIGWEELKCKHGLVKWSVGVNGYKFTNKGRQRRMLKWGGGVEGFYTSTEDEMVIDEDRTVTLWYNRSAEEPWCVKGKRGDGSSGTMLFPRWKSVLDNSDQGIVGEKGRWDFGEGGQGKQGDMCVGKKYEKPKECERLKEETPVECERDYKRQLEWERQREHQRDYGKRKERKKQMEMGQRKKEKERKKQMIKVDNTFFYEGCGWILYRLRGEKRDWRKEEREQLMRDIFEIADTVEVVDYDDVADDSDADVWEADAHAWPQDVDEDTSMLNDGEGGGGSSETQWEGESKLMYWMF